MSGVGTQEAGAASSREAPAMHFTCCEVGGRTAAASSGKVSLSLCVKLLSDGIMVTLWFGLCREEKRQRQRLCLVSALICGAENEKLKVEAVAPGD